MRNRQRTNLDKQSVLLGVTLITYAILLSGCIDLDARLGITTATPVEATQDTTPTGAAPTLKNPSTGIPAAIPNESEPGTTAITVWMPPSLAPNNETPSGQELLDQIAAFDEIHPEIQVKFLAKTTTGPGSALAYLRTAPPVAPTVLPDLVLLDQAALIDASREKLIVPMSTLIDPAILSEMYPAAVDLGTVDGDLAGLVYLLEFQHLVYRDVYFTVPPDSFGAMLESPVPYLFPAGADQNVSTTFLYHYLSSGGTLIDADGKPHLDVDPLRTVLTFYLSAREKGIIDNTLFQISDTSETWGNYRDRGAGLATVSSTQYLSERQAARPSRTTWIPTVNGQPYALVTGWSWAIVAHDPDQQAAAMALLNFLMNPVNQGKFARAAGWVPSQQAALNVWGEDDAYLAFSSTVLSNAHPMPDPILRAAVGPALQAAVENVMLQDMLPAQAATQAAQTINIGP